MPLNRLRLGAAVLLAAFAASVAYVRADGSGSPCPSATVTIGTYCLSQSLQTAGGQSTADYFTAARACATQGGRLPTPDELIGAAEQVNLAGRLDDDPAHATIDTDPSDGLTDWREMTSTLVTTRSGSDASGSLGVSDQATGDPATGEPNPTPAPADTAPASLQYVTVTANDGHGGFAGSEPVSTPERFRCAFSAQGGGPAPAPSPAPAVQHPTLDSPGAIALSSLGHRGLTVDVACSADCTYRVALTMDRTLARRLGVSSGAKGPVTLALSSARPAHLGAGSELQLRLRPAGKLVSNLRYWLTRRHDPSVAARVVLTVEQDGDGHVATVTRLLTIRR